MTPFLADKNLVNLILVHFMVSIRFMAMILTASVFMLPSMPIPVKFWLSVMLAIVVTRWRKWRCPGCCWETGCTFSSWWEESF